MMTERQITAFRQVMRLGSVTAAAKALSVSQPAISRVIAELEMDLGFALFERRAGKLFPTQDAHCLVSEVERMFYGLERLDQFAREMRGLHHSTLSVASLPMVNFDIVPRALSQFMNAHGGIRITHNVHNSPRIVDLVAAGQADLGIAQIAPNREDVRRLASWRTWCVVAMPADHPLSGRDRISPVELHNVPLVVLSSQTITASYVTQRFADAGVSPLVAIESQPSYAACGLVVAGAGLAIIDPFTPQVFARNTLVTVPFTPSIPFDVHLVAHHDKALSRSAETFADIFQGVMDKIEFAQRLDAQKRPAV